MMNKGDVIRKLIFQAPPDLLADIYELTREENGRRNQTDLWNAIITRAQTLGIFTPEEGHAFLRVVSAQSSRG